MRIRNIIFCIFSFLILVGGIWMYKITTSIQIMETSVIVGIVYIWGYRILVPLGILGIITNIIKVIKYKAEERSQKRENKEVDSKIKENEENKLQNKIELKNL